MTNEISSIIEDMKNTMSGSPWYGKPVLELLNEVDTSLVYEKPGEGVHSMIDLLYHMITWIEFTLHRIEKDREMDNNEVEALDWRQTNPEEHTWNAGIAQLTASTNKIIDLLTNAPESLLDDQVEYREYNFRHLLNGLTQHTIYHVGQIAYLNKLLIANKRRGQV